MAERQCTALVGNGKPCGRDTYGRAWCDKHKGLAKHYRNYKSANAVVANTVTVPVEKLDDTQLEREQTHLFTSVTQRQHLKDVGYVGASDPGHDYRIEWEGKRLSEVLTEGQRRVADTSPEPEEPEVRRPAQPTSSRQQKRRKHREATCAMNLSARHNFEIAIQVTKRLSEEIDATLDGMGEHVFTQRYGESGGAIYRNALQCAYQLVQMTIYSHKLTRDRDVSAITGSDIFMEPPLGFMVSAKQVPGTIVYNGITSTNRLKLWAFFVALHSFKMSLDANYHGQPWARPYLMGISRTMSMGSEVVKHYISLIANSLTSGNSKFRKFWHNAVDDAVHATEHHLMPIINPLFPITMATTGVTQWSLVYLGNDLYGYVVDDIIRSMVKMTSQCLHPRDMMINVYVNRDLSETVFSQWVSGASGIIPGVANIMLPYGVIVIPSKEKLREQATADELLV